MKKAIQIFALVACFGVSALATDCQDLENGAGYLEAAHFNEQTNQLKIFLPDESEGVLDCSVTKGSTKANEDGAIRFEAACPAGKVDSFEVNLSFSAQQGEESLGICRILGLTPN